MKKRQQDTVGSTNDSMADETRSTTITSTLPNNCESDNGDALLPTGINEESAVAESSLHTTIVDDATTITNRKPPSKLRIRVCAVCTNEPALSKYSNASAEDLDIIESIQELEDALESGLHIEDGHKMTSRELKGVERKLEKYQVELKQRRSKANREDEDEEEQDDEEGEGEYDTDDGSAASRGEENNDGDDDSEADADSVDDRQGMYENDDPFLLATGGKALVGEAYQQMLLAKEQHQK